MKSPLTGTVTFLFTDLEGQTRLWEEQPEKMRAALARHDAILRRVVLAHDGQVVKTTGDGLHAAFTRAPDAISAALAARMPSRSRPGRCPGRCGRAWGCTPARASNGTATTTARR